MTQFLFLSHPHIHSFLPLTHTCPALTQRLPHTLFLPLLLPQGRLCVWDVSAGVQVLEVSLGGNGGSAMLFPRHLLAVGASVICDYGDTLRAVRMPVAEKME